MDVSVVAVDDSSAFRSAVGDVVAAAGFRLVGEGETSDDAVRLAAELRPDLVLLDVRLRGADGVDAAARIAALGLPTLVVLLTAGETETLAERARRAGAAAVVDKSLLRASLLRELWGARGS